MNDISKTIILTVILGSFIDNSSIGTNTAEKIRKMLNLSMQDFRKNREILLKETSKDPQYSMKMIRNLNSKDKKFAQQCLITGYMEGGKSSDPNTALILKKFLEIFQMFDAVI